MKRESVLYKTRRRLQVYASKIIKREILVQFYSYLILKKKINISSPKTFNEKIQWCKLYYYPNNPLIVKCTDKIAVRDYIREKGYADTLVPLLGTWDKGEDIEWDKLPNKFVLKCNHGCAYNILCSDKGKLEAKSVIKQLNKWLKEDFGEFNIEPHYSKINCRKILAEEYLGDLITDYKFFCFNGKPEYVYVSNNLINDRDAQIGFFYLNGEKMPLKRDDYEDIEDISFPQYFEEMVSIACDLSKAFPFVRVDFFEANNRFYFAELTFTPGGGMMPFNPDKYDLEWGNLIDIDRYIND